MKRFILSVFTICALGSWPIYADAQSNNGQNNTSSTDNQGIKAVKPKVESGLNGEFKVTPPVSSGTTSTRENIIAKKAAEAERKAAEEKAKAEKQNSTGK